MKFARQARILRGPIDATAVAGVLFLLALFILLGSVLRTPGTLLTINLPDGHPIGGLGNPAMVVAVDNRGQYYFENTPVTEVELKSRLRQAAQSTPDLTLILRADRAVETQVLTHLFEVAYAAGVRHAALAERPPPFAP